MERKALLYPHTYVREDLATLALAFFDRLVLLQPSEKRPEAPFAKLVEAGLLQIITPPPFGEQLVWFERLVRSYEEWGQMMRWPENVSMFKAWPEAVEESVSEIKAALLGRNPSQEDDPILKARVILQLAHDLDQRLEELDQEYESLRQRASRLTEFVLGKDPVEQRFPQWIVEGRDPNWEMQGLKERLRAYAALAPLLPELPPSVVTDQWPVVEELLDFAPDAKRLGSLRLSPLSPLELPETVLHKKRPLDTPEGEAKVQALLAGQRDESREGPRIEAWRLPYAVKDLLKAPARPRKTQLSPGETYLYYLARI